MIKGIFKYFIISLLTNSTFGNFNNEKENIPGALDTFNNDGIRRARHVEFATETTLAHVLNTIARNYPDLNTTKGQSITQIKDQIRNKLRQYMKRKKMKAIKYNKMHHDIGINN